jgi:hypothetical protein
MPYLICSRCGLVVYSAAGRAATPVCVACEGELVEQDAKPTGRPEPGLSSVAPAAGHRDAARKPRGWRLGRLAPGERPG